MTKRFSSAALVLLIAATTGCGLLDKKKPVVQRKKHATVASAMPSSSDAPNAHGAAAPSNSAAHGAAHGQSASSNRGKFALPFAWEQGDNEPLAKTKGFIKELLRDNRDYMKHGPKFFGAFANAQKPRATVVACSDSRVQNAAWDNTPENDNFTVRNIGNLLSTSRGSVEYGVEHLNTSVLLVVGHTGCGAIKAAMGDKRELSPAIRAEVDTIVIPKNLEGQTADPAWTAAVIANVHTQVQAGLDAFAPLVNEGRLTIVGAIYDFRNDLGKGAGRVSIVDVNGNSEPERLNAFVAAVTGNEDPSLLTEKSDGPTPGAPTPNTSIDAITKRIESLANEGSSKTDKH